MSGNALAIVLSVLAGLAGAFQIAMLAQLGDRISVAGALAFTTLVTALASSALLLLARRSFSAYRQAFDQPWWMLTAGLMGMLIVFTITYAGSRLGVAATLGVIIAGQLVAGAAIDRLGLFGSARIPLHWPRLVGILLLAIGAVLSLRK